MKKYQYKFSKVINILIYVALIASVLATAWNIFLVIKYNPSTSINPFYDILKYALMFFVTFALFSIMLSMKLNSCYIIDGNVFKTCFGFIISKYDISQMTEIVLDRTTQKLSVHFENQVYIVIVVKQEWYDQFIEQILLANPKIEYIIESKENKAE